jgi:hypothetical protein
MVVLELVFPTIIVTFNIVDLLHFPFKASFLGEHGNFITSDSLLYKFSYCYSVNELLNQNTHHMLVV